MQVGVAAGALGAAAPDVGVVVGELVLLADSVGRSPGVLRWLDGSVLHALVAMRLVVDDVVDEGFALVLTGGGGCGVVGRAAGRAVLATGAALACAPPLGAPGAAAWA